MFKFQCTSTFTNFFAFKYSSCESEAVHEGHYTEKSRRNTTEYNLGRLNIQGHSLVGCILRPVKLFAQLKWTWTKVNKTVFRTLSKLFCFSQNKALSPSRPERFVFVYCSSSV